MRSLIWKEWHEQSWKLGFGAIVFGAMAAIGMRSRIIDDESMAFSICFMGMTLLPVISSTALVPGERNEKTLESLVSLPVTPERILAVKTLMGVLMCAGPLLVAAIISLLVTQGREITVGDMGSLYLRSIFASLALFMWMLALTIHLPNETRASLLALGVLIFWLMLTGGLLERGMPSWSMFLSPFGFIFVRVDRLNYPSEVFRNLTTERLLLVLAVQIPIALILWFWTDRRFAAMEDRS